MTSNNIWNWPRTQWNYIYVGLYKKSNRNSSISCTTFAELVDRSQNLWKWTPRCLAKLLQDPRNRRARWANTPQGLVNMITLFKTGRGQIFSMPLRISNHPTALSCSKFALDCCRLSFSEWTIITFNRITWSGCDNLGWTIPAVCSDLLYYSSFSDSSSVAANFAY